MTKITADTTLSETEIQMTRGGIDYVVSNRLKSFLGERIVELFPTIASPSWGGTNFSICVHVYSHEEINKILEMLQDIGRNHETSSQAETLQALGAVTDILFRNRNIPSIK